MPISDEIIELEPIKKSKLKVIIMFIAMGVLLALSVTFLVLYLIKPDVTVSSGAVLSVEESPVSTSALSNAKQLFNKSKDDESPEYFATVGVEYTVAVKVSTEGDANSLVSWIVEPSGAVEKREEGSYELGSDGTTEGGKPYIQYLKFSAFPEFAGREVTITARSQSDSTQRAIIKFSVVNQGAESLEFLNIARNEIGSSVTRITTDRITLPFYESKLNSYNVEYAQRGAYNGSEYSDIAVIRKPDGSYSNVVSVSSSDEKVLTARMVETASRPIFEISLVGTGTAEITLSANVNNDNDVVTKKLVIVSESSKSLGFIDDIRIVKEAADEAYFKNLGRNMPTSIPSISIPYGSTYSNILSHVVLSPISLQYDATKDELLDAWKSRIEITSSNNDVITPNKSNDEWVLNVKSKLATGSDCVLTIRDASSNSLGVSRQINVNVVAQNRADGITAEVNIDKTYVDSYIKNNNLPISQGLNASVALTFSVTAPSGVSVDTLNKYVSSNYRLVFDKTQMTVSLSGAPLEPYNPNPTVGEKTNEYDLSSSLEFARQGTSSTYTATATFNVRIADNATNGIKSFKFIKIGSELPNADALNMLNATVEKEIKFNVTNIAQNVMLKTDDIEGIGETAYDLITDNGTYAGKIKDVSYDKNAEGVCIGKYNIYIQRGDRDSDLWFNPSDLIYVDGPFNVSAPAYSNLKGSLAYNGTGSNRTLKFSGTSPDSNSQVTIKYDYTNTNSKKIGEITFNIFLIDGVNSIHVVDTSENTVTYRGADNGLGSFAVDKINYNYRFAGLDNSAKDPYDFDIKVGSADSAVTLKGTWDDDVNRTEKTFSYAYTGADGKEKTIPVVKYRVGYFHLQQDIFALGYLENIDLSRLTISYIPNPEHYPRDGIQPASRVYNFVRIADDIGLYTENDYETYNGTEVGSVYTVNVNHNSTLKLYTSPIVRIDSRDIVTKRLADQPTGGVMLAVEDAFLRLPNGFTPAGITGRDEKDTGAYRYIVLRTPDSAPGTTPYTDGVVRLDSVNKGELRINILNYMRNISSINIYNTSNSANFNSDNEIKDIVFGMFNNASGEEQKVLDKTSKTIYVRVDYVAHNSNQSEFEAAVLNIPQGFTASEGVRTGITGTLELLPPAIMSDVEADEFGKTWEVIISLDKSTAKDGINEDGLNVYNNSSATAPDRRISASIKTTVVTGVQSISSTLNDQQLKYEFTNSDAVTKDIDISVIANTAFAGYNNVAYDFENLTCSMKDKSGNDIAGVSASFSHIGDDTNPHIELTVDPKLLAKTLTAEQVVFTFVDNVNDTNKTFTLKVNVSVTMEVWAISQPTSGYTVTTNGANVGEADCDLNITYNEGSVIQPSSTALSNVVMEVAVYDGESGKYNRVENAGLRIADGKVYVLNSMLSSDSVQYYVHVYYGADKTLYSAVPVNIQTNALDLALSDDAKNNVESGVANLKFAANTDSFDLSAVVVNGGNGDGTDKTGITYTLYSDSDRKNTLVSTIAQIDANGMFKLLAPESATGTIYYRATYTDESSGKTRKLDLTVNYTVLIKSVTLSDIDNSTYSNNTVTLYYAGASGHTMLDLSGHITLSTDFASIAPTTCVITFTADNADIVASDIFSGTNRLLVPVKAGSSPFTITATDATGEEAHLDFTLDIIGLEAATLDSYSGSVNVIKNGQVTITPTNIASYDALDCEFTLTGDDKFTFAKSDDAVKVSLDRTKFINETDSDDKPYTLTATVNYTYKNTMTPVIVGTLAPTAVYTLTVTDDFDEFDFDLYKGAEKVEDKASINIDHTATYILKFPLPQNATSWYTPADWTFKAVSSQTNIATLANGGMFDNANGEVTVTPKTTGYGYVTFTVTATAYGTTATVEKSYTFTVTGGTEVTMTYKTEGKNQTEISFGEDGVANQAVEIDFVTDPAEFVYTVNVKKTGVTPEEVVIDFVGDVTAMEVVQNGDSYSRTFTASKPTTLIVSSAVKMNGATFYSKKYTVNITATQPNFAITGDSAVNPAATLQLGISKASKFKGNYNVIYSIVQTDAGVSVNESTGLVTAPTVNLTDKVVTVRAEIEVTSGAFMSNVKYIVEKSITVIGVPLPEISWKDKTTSAPITVLGPSALTAGGAATINLVEYVKFTDEVRDSFGSKHTYTDTELAYTASTNLTSDDYTLTSDGKLTIKASQKNRAGGLINVTVTATLSGINAGRTVSAKLAVMLMPELQEGAAVYISGKADTYPLGTLVSPVAYARDGSVKTGDNYTVRYSLSSDLASKYSIFSDTLRVIGAITTVETIPVTVDVVITSGAYKGTSMTKTVNVTVLGTPLNPTNVSWNEAANAYNVVNAYNTIDRSKLPGWTVSGIFVTTDNTSYSTVDEDGTNNAKIRVDREFNIASSTGAANAPMIVYYDILLTKSGVTGEVHCYGVGQLSVQPIAPEITVEIDGVEVEDNIPSQSVPGGQSFLVNYNEKKNLNLTDVTVTNCGSYLSYEVVGSSVLFTASSAVYSDQSARTVSVRLSYASRTGNISITKQISVTVTKVQSSLYDVTNTSIELPYYSSNGSSYKVYSVWTATDANERKYPVKLDITSSSRLSYLFDNSNSSSEYILIYLYNASGTQYGPVQYSTSSISNSATSISISLYYQYRIEVQRLGIVLPFKNDLSYSSTININYYTSSTAGSYSGTYTQKTYSIRRVYNSPLSVTFNANGGTIDGSTTKIISGNYGANASAPGNPTRTGYTFKGWYPMTSPDFSVDTRIIQITEFAALNAYSTFTITFNSTYYAAWTMDPTTVTLNAGDGEIKVGNQWLKTSSIVVYYGNKYNSLPTASSMRRTGYTFASWTLSGTPVTSSTTVTTTGEHALSATWTANNIAVTFDPNGGTLDSLVSTKTVKYDEAYGDLPVPTRVGHTFKGWKNGNSAVNKNTVCKSTTAVTLTAEWETIKYTVTLNPNVTGMDGSSKEIAYGNGYGTLSTLERTGYTFGGWYTQPNGGGTQIADASGAAVNDTDNKVTANITLYAKWIVKKINVVFDKKGGTGTASSKQVDFDATYGAPLPTVTKTGNVFDGWTLTDGGTDYVVSTSKVTTVGTDSTITLYAHFTAKTYTVTLVDSHKKATKKFITVSYGGKFAGLEAELADTGYVFDGWFDNATGGGSEVTADSTVDDLANGYTLYAVWHASTVTISFNVNKPSDAIGNISKPDSVDYSYGGVYKNLPTVTVGGYDFAGWFTASSSGAEIKNGDTVTATDSIALYAHWTAKQYTVTLVDSHNTASLGSIEVTFAGQFTGLEAGLTDPGYTFNGWFDNTAGTGTPITASTKVGNLADGYTLYAVWEAKTSKVTLYNNNGTGTTDEITVTVGKTYADLSGKTPAYAGYTFLGWFTQEEGGELVTPNTAVVGDDFATRLYAHWSVDPVAKVEVVFDANDGTVLGAASYTTTVDYGSTTALVNLVPTRDGYTFLGWFDDRTDGTEVTSETTFTAETTTVHAHWEPVPVPVAKVEVVFDANGGTVLGADSYTATLDSGSTTALVNLVPTRDGFNFLGWFDDETDGEEVTSETAFTADTTTVYAHWEPVPDTDTDTDSGSEG